MRNYVPDPENPGQHIDTIELLRRDPSKPLPVHIDGLLKRDLWTRQEALLILVGLDPCNVVHGGYPIGTIGAGIRYLDGTASAQLDAQGLQHPRAQDWLPEFDRLKGYAAGQDMGERKAPSEWIAWAESKDFTPYWRAEPQPAPAGDTCIEGEDAAEFIECANNGGEPIDWLGWIADRPVLKAADAARLLAGLEPTTHKSLEIERNESAGEAKRRAREFEGKAEAQGKERATPAEWLAWADGLQKKIPVHIGFRLAVERYASASKSESPAAEWKHASPQRKQELVAEAMRQHGNNQTRAAASLRMSRTNLAKYLPDQLRNLSATVAPQFPESAWNPRKR